MRCRPHWDGIDFNCYFSSPLVTETHAESITLALYLHTLVSFTAPNTWAILKQKNLAPLKPGMIQLCSNIMGSLVQKGFFLSLRVSQFNSYLYPVKERFNEYHFRSFQTILLKGTCRTTVTLKPISLKAILSLSVRPLISANFSENLMTMFLVHILSMPALIYQMEQLVPECIQTLQSHTMLRRTLEILETEQSMKIIINSMKGTQSLALLANVIHLFNLEPIESAQELGFPTFTVSFRFDLFAGSEGLNIEIHSTVCVQEIAGEHSEFSRTERWGILSMARIARLVLAQSRCSTQRKFNSYQKAIVFAVESSHG